MTKHEYHVRSEVYDGYDKAARLSDEDLCFIILMEPCDHTDYLGFKYVIYDDKTCWLCAPSKV